MKWKSLLLAFLFAPGLIPALEVNIDRSFLTTEKGRALVYAGPGSRIHYRIYRLEDPVDFFRGQKNTRSAEMAGKRNRSGFYLMGLAAAENIKWSLFMGARRYMKASHRKQLLAAFGLKSWNYPYEDFFPAENSFQRLPLPLVREWRDDKKRGSYWQAREARFPRLAAGLYLLEASQGRHIAHTPFLITDIAMTVKEGASSRLVYAVDLQNKKPVADAEIITLENSYESTGREITGRFQLRKGIYFEKNLSAAHASQQLYLLRSGSHWAVSDISFYAERSHDRLTAAIYTDRPVYRQGNDVSWRAVVLSAADGRVSPASGMVEWTVLSPGNQILYKEKTRFSSFGTIHGSLTLPESAQLGNYRIQLEISGRKLTGGFHVEQYRKPAFEIVRLDKAGIFGRKDALTWKMKAQYYSKAPVPGAAVEYEISRQRISVPWWYGFEYSWYYTEDGYGDPWEDLSSGKAITDAKGNFSVSYEPAKQLRAGLAVADDDYVYRVKVSVTGAERENIEANFDHKFVRSPWNLNLSQKRWYYSTENRVDLKVSALFWENERPAGGLNLTLELHRLHWDGGARRYREEAAETTFTARTDENGEAVFDLDKPTRGGAYRAVVFTPEHNGKRAEFRMDYHVYEGSSSEEEPERELSVRVDKTRYSPGDRLEYRVVSPFPSGRTLVTFETDEILEYRILENTTSDSLQLNSRHSPNFTISAQVLATGSDGVPGVYRGSREVIVPPSDRFLKLTLTPDRNEFRPGETARVLVQTMDGAGRPVSAEFSLATVDAAIYAIRQDPLSSMEKNLYPRIWHQVSTGDSLSYRFYSYGREEKLYSLAEKNRERYFADFKAAREEKVRKDFKDTAFWLSDGRTGADGRAFVDIPLPDNLTRFRLTAHAVSEKGEAGSARENITVNQPVTVRLALPRFFREKDTMELRVIVQNQTEKVFPGGFRLNLNGIRTSSKIPASLDLKPGLTVIPFNAEIFSLPDGDRHLATLEAAFSGGESDAVRLSIPVLPYGTEKEKTEINRLKPDELSARLSFTFPADARPETAELSLSLTDGVLSAISQTLPYLIQYPYGCVEQTLGTFVPLALARSISRRTSLTLPVNAAESSRIMNAGLQRLYDYQHPDGGWGWWKNDTSHPYMSAYVLYGFHLAQQAGITPQKDILDRGLRYLERLLTESPPDQSTRIFQQVVHVLFAPAAAEKYRPEWRKLLTEKEPNPYLLSLIIIADRGGKPADAGRARLLSLAKRDGHGLYFQGQGGRYDWRFDREETTAFALQALLTGDSRDEKAVPEVVSWILSARNQQRWRNTKTSALLVHALADYAVKSGETSSRGNISFTVNGTAPVSGSAADLTAKIHKLRPRGETVVDLKRESRGLFLVEAAWRYHSAATDAITADFRIERKYYPVRKVKRGDRLVLSADRNPARSFQSGDLVLSVTTLKGADRGEFLLLEDRLPSGFESAAFENILYFGSDVVHPLWDQGGRQVFDDRVSTSRTWLHHGEWRNMTLLRAEYPGKFHAMPATGGFMYYPESAGSSGADAISISD